MLSEPSCPHSGQTGYKPLGKLFDLNQLPMRDAVHTVDCSFNITLLPCRPSKTLVLHSMLCKRQMG